MCTINILLLFKMSIEFEKIEEWCKVFSDVLGKDSSDYSEELAVLLLAVDQSVKPAFMWDYTTLPPATLQNMLQLLHGKQLITNALSVVSIEMDTFIVNLDAVARNLIGYLTGTYSWIIDISKPEPKVASQQVHDVFKSYSCTMLQQLGMAGKEVLSQETNVNTELAGVLNSSVNTERTLLEDVKHSCDQSGENSSSLYGDSSSAQSACASGPVTESKVFSLDLPEEANLSSIFGCLLGYPQVYWWDSESDSSSLSGLPLKVYKLSASCAALPPQDDCVELFSFSVPEVLESALRPSMQHWGNIAHTKVEQASRFSKASFNCDPVLCLKVSL